MPQDPGKMAGKDAPDLDAEAPWEEDAQTTYSSDVCCTSCGEENPSAFSNRMLRRPGRHGVRTRLCRKCAGNADPEDVQDENPFASDDDSSNGNQPAGRLKGAQKKRAAKLQSALRKVHESKQLRASGGKLNIAQAELINREAELMGKLQKIDSILAKSMQTELAAGFVKKASPLLTAQVPPATEATKKTDDSQRLKLAKTLREIEELKRRRASGETLQKAQGEKIAREGQVKAELLRLGPAPARSPVAAPVAEPTRVGTPVQQRRVKKLPSSKGKPGDAAEDSEDAVAAPKKRKLKRNKACIEKTGGDSVSAAAADGPDDSAPRKKRKIKKGKRSVAAA